MKDPARERGYRRTYYLLGGLMLASPFLAAILAHLLGASSSFVFFAEASGVWIFALYWIVKGREIRRTDADTLAAERKLVARAHSLRDFFHTIQIAKAENVGSQPATGQG
jgi:hypothetical protein